MMNNNHGAVPTHNDESLYHLAFYDLLTGLPNRANLMDHFRRALMRSARDGTYGALMFCDLDKFKAVNDSHGHQTGDQLLRAAAQRLEQCVREVDLVARHGGDEFIVLISPKERAPEEAAYQAEAVATKIIASLGAPYALGDITYAGSVSVGIVIFNGTDDTVESSFRRADRAMYEAKQSGRNQFRFFDMAMQQAMASRYTLDRAIVNALRDDQFVLHYQPQVDMRGRVTGAEALLRWRLPNGVVAHPSEFINVAEESGLIIEIGTWVLKSAAAQLAGWQARPEMSHISLSVNLSSRQFARLDLSTQVANIFKQCGADPSGLTLELNEGLLMSDPPHFAHQAAQLSELGICLALVDVGVGGSALRQLSGLPIKQLKISRALTNGMTGCSIDAVIVRSIIAVADILNLSLIGEGIESSAQIAFLADAGCVDFQGYFYKPAMPATAFVEYALQNCGVHKDACAA